jgi:hypothetical protein
MSSFKLLDDLFRNGFLLFAVIEDGGTVLRAHVRTLPVQCRRVMYVEENLQDFPVRNLSRVEGHPDSFGMTGLSSADLLIGGIDGRAPSIAGQYILDTVNLLEDSLDTPETATRESRNF